MGDPHSKCQLGGSKDSNAINVRTPSTTSADAIPSCDACKCSVVDLPCNVPTLQQLGQLQGRLTRKPLQASEEVIKPARIFEILCQAGPFWQAAAMPAGHDTSLKQDMSLAGNSLSRAHESQNATLPGAVAAGHQVDHLLASCRSSGQYIATFIAFLPCR